MKAEDDPLPPTRIRLGMEESRFDRALHEFAHTKAARIGFLVVALATVAALGTIVVPAVRSIVSARRGSTAMANGDKAMDASKYGEAISQYSFALDEELTVRDRTWAFAYRGFALTKLNRDREAISDFTAALQLAPGFEFARLNRALTNHRLGKFNEALSDYDQVIRVDPNALDAYFNRASINAHLGNFSAAIADLDEAIRCVPGSARLYTVRGDFYAQAHNAAKAEQSYESAIQFDPEYVDAYSGLANIFAGHGNAGRALTLVDHALSQHPNSASLYFARGLVHLMMQAPQSALEDFDQVIRRDPKFARAYSARGAVELWLGRPDAAAGYATRAAELDPELAHAYYVRARAYDDEMDYSDAVADFDEAIKHDSEYVMPVIWRALSESHSGAHERARRDLAAATTRFPASPECHWAYAWFLATCPSAAYRNGPLAIAEAARAADLSQDDPYTVDALAAAYAESGDFGRACDAESKALAKVPESNPDRKRMAKRLALFRNRQAYRDHQ